MDRKSSDRPAPETGEIGPADYHHSRKNRVFARPVQGEYNLGKKLERLRAMPRVRKAREIKFIDGPQATSRHDVEPKDSIGQLVHRHLEEYGPGGKSRKHGHANEAAIYILDGEGYGIDDDIRHDWKAGHVVDVPPNTTRK